MKDLRNPNLGVLATCNNPGWRASLGKSELNLSGPRANHWWTGKAPHAADCPGVDRQGFVRPLPIPDLASCTRQSVIDYFDNGWTLTEVLFSALNCEESFYKPPYHGLRHPLIFYYAHPAALYINKLRVAGLLSEPVDEYFESLFETGVDEMSWDDMSKNEIEWPALDKVHQYRRQAYSVILDMIETHPGLQDGHAPIEQSHPLWALFMGFEHERIHLETSSVLIRELPVNLVQRPAAFPEPYPLSIRNEARTPEPGLDYRENRFITVDAGLAAIGKSNETPIYGWDNEYGERSQALPEFRVSKYLISNGEFWHFVADGGYTKEEYWTEQGWRWRCFRNVKWPTFWVADGPQGTHQYQLRTCFETIPMQWSWPSVVNYHEAKAYLRWRSEQDKVRGEYRLMSEMEHARVRVFAAADEEPNALQHSPNAYNLDLRYGSESPVDRMVSDGTAIGDLFGNVWQWCEDHFNPLPGFTVHKYYDDFSTPCFDGEHQMIMGGSFVSTGDMSTPFARFHFRPHFFQHAGFRLVYSADNHDGGAVKLGDKANGANRYKADRTLEKYINLHYGTAEAQMAIADGPHDAVSFPRRCAKVVTDWCDKLGISTGTALDIGCSVGGASFELARAFSQVTAVDLSEQFIDFALELKTNGNATYKICEEGEIHTNAEVSVPRELRDKVFFKRADACCLPADYLNFDAVLLANVICRLPSPMSCLGRLGGKRGIVKPGGLVVIASPFTWTETFTPKQVWLGGYEDEDGTPHWSFDGLKEAMSEEFDLLETRDMPMIIREHRRNYHYIVPLVSVWQRRS